MRDPDGATSIECDRIVRTVTLPSSDHHFLKSDTAKKFAQEGLITDFQINENLIISKKIPFVSYPFEWCDSQFFDAGHLTIEIESRAILAGYDLKDSSAWNIVFEGGFPRFVDLLSFTPLTSHLWHAAGQYGRHFLTPLNISSQRGLRAHTAFLIWLDGYPPEVAREILGLSRYLTRQWPLMLGSGRWGNPSERNSTTKYQVLQEVTSFRIALNTALRWMLDGVRPRRPKLVKSKGLWTSYRGNRSHYQENSLQEKIQIVVKWVAAINPAWVVDLGCNDGEFSDLVAGLGASVVSIDSDHDCIEALYQRNKSQQRIYPVIAPLDDLVGGRGWDGEEYRGLIGRLEGNMDLVLVLALIHHLAVGNSIPLSYIARTIAKISKKYAIVEFIDPTDLQMKNICAHHNRNPCDFSVEAQRKAFINAGFTIDGEEKLSGTERYIVLLRKFVA